jgi:hypothetical protein
MSSMYPPQPAPQPQANDRTTLFGVLSIVVGTICCGIIGLIFGFLSLQSAKRVGRPPTLAYIGIALSALNIIGGVIWSAARLGN